MTQSEIEEILIDVVNKIQKVSGRDAFPIIRNTKPVSEIPDFDSLNGVEATIDALSRLDLDLEFNNVFVQDDQSLSIKQAAARLFDCMAKQPEKQS